MKNFFLLCSMLTVSFLVCATEEFSAQKFHWKYKVHAKDASDLKDFTQFNSQFQELISSINRGSNSNMYLQMLNFLKELQEAIVAGLNLFGTVETAHEPVLQVVEQATAAIVDSAIEHIEGSALIEQAEQIEQDQTAAVVKDVVLAASPAVVADPELSIDITCFVLDEKDVELWKLATTKLQTIADQMNNNQMTADEVINSLSNVYNDLVQMKDSGLMLSSAIFNKV